LTLLVGRQEGHPACKNGGWCRWARVTPDGVAPSRMVGVSASINLPLDDKDQKFSYGTGSPGWSRKRAVKRLWCGGANCGYSSVIFRRRCNTLCTSGFVDDVMFSRNRPQWRVASVITTWSPRCSEWSKFPTYSPGPSRRLTRPSSAVAARGAPRAMCDIYDCLVWLLEHVLRADDDVMFVARWQKVNSRPSLTS